MQRRGGNKQFFEKVIPNQKTFRLVKATAKGKKKQLTNAQLSNYTFTVL